MQLAAARDLDSVGTAQVLHAKRGVSLRLALDARLELAQSNRVAVLAREGARVDDEEHRHGRLLDVERRHHGVGSLGRAHSISQIYIRGAGEPDDVARSGLFDLGAVEPFRDVKVCAGRGVRRDDLPVRLLVILPARVCAQDFVSLFQHSLENSSAADASEILAPRERADLHQEGLVHLRLRRGDALDYRVEQVVHAGL